MNINTIEQMINDYKDIVTLLRDKTRRKKEFLKLTGMSRTTLFERLHDLMKRGIVKQCYEITMIYKYAKIEYSLKKIYKHYSIISSIDDVFCKRPFCKKKLLLLGNVDLTRQYESLHPYSDVEKFLIPLFQSAKSVTFITDRDKRYAEVTKNWIEDNLNISKFTIVFINGDDLIKNKINEIKQLYNNLSFFSYNILIENEVEVIKNLRFLENQGKSTERIKNDPIVNNFHDLIHMFHARQEFKILMFVHESFLKEHVLLTK